MLGLKLLTLKEKRERGDSIMMFKTIRGLEKVDREDLQMKDDRRAGGY